MKPRLDSLIREAREAGRTPPPVDWGAVDRGLFARIEEDRRAERVRVMTTGRSRVWTAGAAVLAAAAFAVVLGKSRETRSLDPDVAVSAPPAGLVSTLSARAALQIDGKAATVGAEVHVGDRLEVHGGQATVERTGRVTLLAEDGARATVTHDRGSLVLALDHGALEGQVVPVASGEAFAVDVEGARVAVHGTHLRVARVEGRVTVDLTEGVVVVGHAPRVGSTVGALVTAPAHVEFSAADPEATLTVTHDPAAVRPAATMDGTSEAPATVLPTPPARPAGPRATVPAAPARPAASATPPGAHPAIKADPNAGAAIAAAVRSCLATRAAGSTVAIEVTTTLHLELDDGGNVKAARFDPPVAPDVNGCAATTIYKTRFTHEGTADVRVDFTAPASAP